MTTDDHPAGVRALAERLGVAPDRLAFLRGTDDGTLACLDDLVASAAARHDEELDQALESTVHFVPRPLRGRVRRLLVPENHR